MFYYQDQVELVCASGSGGSGAISFHRTRHRDRGGPDGGDGGRGGNIIFSSRIKVRDFNHLKKRERFTASPGNPGQSQMKAGSKGENRIIPVPLGTVLKDIKANLLADFDRPRSLVFLKGGRGGRGNAWFKTSQNQAPRYFHRGCKGQEKKFILEYKPLIKASLIGRANTGKSTFFNAITGAHSPTAEYPYTTLVPYYGRIKTLGSDCVLMDIPGISRGAHQKPEKGLSFLRSLQRASLLIHFIDSTIRDPMGVQKELEEELKAFDRKFSEKAFSPLSKKKRWIVFTKIDLLQNQTFRERVTKPPAGFFTLSNKTGEGIRELVSAIKKEFSS